LNCAESSFTMRTPPSVTDSVPPHFDIVILGGGLNGAALASALKNGPHSVALVEPQPPAPPGPEAVWDSRIYAYSPGNVEWLQSLGGWNDPVRAQAVYAMKIHGDSNGRLTFDAIDAGLPELAWIAENGRLQYALWQSLAGHPNVRLLPTPATAVTWAAGDQPRHLLHLANGEVISTNLLIGADGALSWLRTQAGIGYDEEDYKHIGVVANFETEKPHRGSAFQWFRADGVLAYLPLPGNRISMVWSTPPEHAAELRALSPAELCRQVADAGAGALGKLHNITAAAGFPLKRRRAHEWVRSGLALIGDAAHTVHPLAGQGVNLGFRDSRLLAEVLASGGNPGEIGRLTAYAARRMEDVASMQFTTGSLKKLFAHDDSLTRNLRNWGMSLANQIQPINQALTRHAVL
jgi:2-octaprenylphenol hydroxylase